MEDEAAMHLKRASRAIKSAKILLNQGLLEDAYSRAYYGLLHLVMALFIKIGESLPKTHAGIIAKTWAYREKLKLSDDEVKAVSRYQSLRENGDYSPIPGVEEKDVIELIDFVKELGRRHGIHVV